MEVKEHVKILRTAFSALNGKQFKNLLWHRNNGTGVLCGGQWYYFVKDEKGWPATLAGTREVSKFSGHLQAARVFNFIVNAFANKLGKELCYIRALISSTEEDVWEAVKLEEERRYVDYNHERTNKIKWMTLTLTPLHRILVSLVR